MKIEFEGTFKEVLAQGVNLFIGSGFSVLASDSMKRPLPVGPELKNELLKQFNKNNLKSLALDKICTILKSEKLSEFNEYLVKRFTVYNYDTSYNVLNNINISAIVTTNIDDLIYKIFSDSFRYYINDVTKRGSLYQDKKAIDYIPLHGSVIDQPVKFTFSTSEIASSFSQNRDKWYFLTNSLQKKPTLFWGYSVEDAGVLEALDPATISGREKKPIWIVLKNENEAEIAYFKSLNFNIIISDTKELLAYLNNNISYKEAKCESFDTTSLFPEYSLPNIGIIPVRPIVHFYNGEAPSWSDIYSGKLYKLNIISK